MKKLLILAVISIFFGCVNKSDYETLEKFGLECCHTCKNEEMTKLLKN